VGKILKIHYINIFAKPKKAEKYGGFAEVKTAAGQGI